MARGLTWRSHELRPIIAIPVILDILIGIHHLELLRLTSVLSADGRRTME